MLVVDLRNNLPVTEVGGKGYSLRILLDNGFNVPKGFVITSEAFFEYLTRNGLMAKTEKLVSRIDENNVPEKSEEIKDSISSGKMPKEITSEVENKLIRLIPTFNVQYVSIRSSAVSEDSSKASFAGLHDTFLNVKTDLSLVLENIKKCWSSLFNNRAVIYRIKKEIPHLEGMAVIVQEMIPAEVSGTAFTAHPDTGDMSMMVIECSWGLGQAVVSGLIVPDRYIVNKSDPKVINKILGTKKVTIKTKENGVARMDTSEDKMTSFCLNDALIENLAMVCLNIEYLFKYPQDIEWCIQKNRIWILQSRYITTLGR